VDVKEGVAAVHQRHVVVADDESVKGSKDFHRIRVVGIPHAANEFAFAYGLATLAFKREESAGFGPNPGSLAEVPRLTVLAVTVLEAPHFRDFVGVHAQVGQKALGSAYGIFDRGFFEAHAFATFKHHDRNAHVKALCPE